MIGRKPDLICIGAAGAATEWVYQALQSRDDCWSPPFRAVDFFTHRFCKENRGEIHKRVIGGIEFAASQHRKNRARQEKELDEEYLAYLDMLTTLPPFNGTWYKQVFSRAPDRMICLDVTPDYSILPEDGVDFVAKFLKGARFVCLLPDPVDRALAQMRQMVADGVEAPATGEDWADLTRRVAADPRSDYASFVPRWQKRFDSRRLLILPNAAVLSDPTAALRKLEAFANLVREDSWGIDRGLTDDTGVTVPDDAVKLLADLLAPQSAFVLDHLGPDFIQK